MKPEIAVLIETYTAIAATMPQVHIEHHPSAVIARGPFAHPLCNFGVVLANDGLPQVLRAAMGRSHFNIYTFESLSQGVVEGYVPALALRVMTAPAAAITASPLLEATTIGERMVVTRFMADQFFPNHKNDIRERIAEASARAKGIAHYAFRAGNDPTVIGATMLSVEGPMVGLFNVCVDKSRQGRGWGADIVRQMLNEAAIRGRATTLQCELSLEGWYEKLGFHAVDTLTVWTVSGHDPTISKGHRLSS